MTEQQLKLCLLGLGVSQQAIDRLKAKGLLTFAQIGCGAERLVLAGLTAKCALLIADSFEGVAPVSGDVWAVDEVLAEMTGAGGGGSGGSFDDSVWLGRFLQGRLPFTTSGGKSVLWDLLEYMKANFSVADLKEICAFMQSNFAYAGRNHNLEWEAIAGEGKDNKLYNLLSNMDRDGGLEMVLILLGVEQKFNEQEWIRCLASATSAEMRQMFKELAVDITPVAGSPMIDQARELIRVMRDSKRIEQVKNWWDGRNLKTKKYDQWLRWVGER